MNKDNLKKIWNNIKSNIDGSKAIIDKNVGLDEYETFSEAKKYTAGYTLLKDGLLYTFITDHAAGAWNPVEVEETNIREEVGENIGLVAFRGSVTSRVDSSYKLLHVYIPKNNNFYIKYSIVSEYGFNLVYVNEIGNIRALGELGASKEGIRKYKAPENIICIGIGYNEGGHNEIPFFVDLSLCKEGTILYDVLESQKTINEKLSNLSTSNIVDYYYQKSDKNFISSFYNNTLCGSLFNDFNKKYAIIEIPTINAINVWVEFDLNIVRMFKVASVTKSLTIKANLYINHGIFQYSFTNKEGKTEVIDNSILIANHSGNAAIILGTENTQWGFLFIQINNLNVLYARGNTSLYKSPWSLNFNTDLSDFSNIQNATIESYDSNLLQDYATKEDLQNVQQNTGSSKLAYISSLRDVYISSIGHIKDLLNDNEKKTPVNLLFIGDSITNFQNGWEVSADKELPKVSNERPLCMYNPYTFTSYIWKMLNPNAVDRAYRDLIYGGNMGFVKATHDTKVTKSGTFISSYDYSTGAYNGFGSNGGYPANGIKEFLYTKNIGDYIEFKVPANIKGFSVIANCYQGSKGSTSSDMAAATTQMQVSYNGSVMGTESLAIQNGTNKRFDYVIDSLVNSESTIKVLNNEDNKYMGIWGIEYWTDKCVRPINNGLAGNNVSSFVNGYDDWVKGANPDIIVYEANILNDTALNYNNALEYYKTLFNRFKEDSYKVVVLITHAVSKEYKNISININDCPDINDESQTPRYYIQYQNLVIELCKKYDIPYINVCQYQIDKYNGDIPTDLFAGDNIHLSYKGHDMYKELIEYAMKNSY